MFTNIICFRLILEFYICTASNTGWWDLTINLTVLWRTCIENREFTGRYHIWSHSLFVLDKAKFGCYPSLPTCFENYKVCSQGLEQKDLSSNRPLPGDNHRTSFPMAKKENIWGEKSEQHYYRVRKYPTGLKWEFYMSQSLRNF